MNDLLKRLAEKGIRSVQEARIRNLAELDEVS